MAVYSPESKKEGTKLLFFGPEASGKTPTGLSFPNIFLADSDSSSNFYEKENVKLMSDALTYKDLESDFDEIEMDDELFDSIDTFMVDSLTKYHDAMNIAMNKVAERRASKNGRDSEAEIMSFREHTKSKTYYKEFFSKLITYVKLGKNLVCIAEQKDKTETINGELKKVGVTFNAPKFAGYDFDIIVRTFLEETEIDGKKEFVPKGEILKDRTKTFKFGQIIDKPHYDLWKDAIEKKQKGKQRSKDEIKTITEASEEETTVLDEGESLRSEIMDIVRGLQDKVTAKSKLIDEVGTHEMTKINDPKKLQKALEVVKKLK